jgi:hypothetical protein
VAAQATGPAAGSVTVPAPRRAPGTEKADAPRGTGSPGGPEGDAGAGDAPTAPAPAAQGPAAGSGSDGGAAESTADDDDPSPATAARGGEHAGRGRMS